MRLLAFVSIILLTPTILGAATPEQTFIALQSWQLEEALKSAQSLMVEDPNEPINWMLAGRVQHQRGEHFSALALLKAAQNKNIEVDDILDLVESSAGYQTHFKVIETPHFKIHYIDKDRVVADYARPVLEASYTRIGEALRFLPAERGEKIAVEIYPDARGLSSATGLSIKEIETSGTIAICKFHRLMITSPLATANGYHWADTLAHEFTHLLVSKKSRNTIPIWLHEGIAKFYESIWSGEPGLALQPYSEKLLADAVRNKKLIPFAKMHPSMAKLPSQEDTALAFAEVFTMVEFIRHQYGEGSIPQILESTASGIELNKAFLKVTGVDIKTLEAQWRRYLATRSYREIPGAALQKIVLASKNEEVQSEKPLETITDKETHDRSRLGELLQIAGHQRAAAMEYENAYKKAGLRYPTLLYRLASVYVSTHREQEAIALLNKSLAVHANDLDLRLLLGRLLLSTGSLIPARKNFDAVNLQNPFNPEVHAALRMIYEKLGDEKIAQTEREYFELTSKPRPRSTYELPKPKHADAFVRITTRDWKPVRIDGVAFVTPAWDVPLAAGDHTINDQRFQVQRGETKFIELP
jgi:tetratricopeptide (TPR) repeat protein